MNSPDVVAALRAGAPDAAGQLYDAHAEGLYQYCWLVLRSGQRAQVAMRDAVILADARITGLRDPSMLKAWLFAIARAECGRHRPGSAGESDEPVAPPQQRDAALRIMAWNSVISLAPDEREALDLVTRHGMTPPEVALVLGLPAPDAPALIAAARLHLEQALTAEILINRESQECAGRADALRGWTGTVTPAVRERLLRHAGSCPACLPRRPRNVSAARIFGLLPRPALTESGWAGVLSRLSDPEPPDADAQALLDADILDTGDTGVPCPQDAGVLDPQDADVPGTEHAGGPGGASPRPRGRRVCAGVGAAVAAVGVAAALAAGSLGGHAALSGAAHHLPAAADGPAQARVGPPVPQPDSGPAMPGATPRHARPASWAAAGGGAGQADDDPGQLTRATAPAAPSVIAPARVPLSASNTTLLPGPAGPAGPPGGPGDPAQLPGPSASASPAASGQLEVSPSRLDVGTGSYGRIVLTASGGAMSWTASASSANITLSRSSGQLSAGQSVTLVVDVRRQDGAGGNAAITIATGSAGTAAAVQVTWDADGSAPPPGRHRPRRPPSPTPAAS